MKKKLLFCFLLLLPFSAISDDVLKLDWIDLVPEQERNQFDAIGMPKVDHNGAQMQQSLVGGGRQE